MTIRNAIRCATAICCAIVPVAAVLSGCDTIGSDTITLQKKVDFRFEFSTSGIDAGEELQVNALAAIDFADVIAAEGFSKGDLIAVRVQSVHVQRISPAGTTLDAFDRVAFSLTATGLTARTIAELDDLPNARDADLTVLVTDVTQVVRQPAFLGRLTVAPRSSHSEQYVLTASMDIAVEVEGV